MVGPDRKRKPAAKQVSASNRGLLLNNLEAHVLIWHCWDWSKINVAAHVGRQHKTMWPGSMRNHVTRKHDNRRKCTRLQLFHQMGPDPVPEPHRGVELIIRSAAWVAGSAITTSDDNHMLSQVMSPRTCLSHENTTGRAWSPHARSRNHGQDQPFDMSWTYYSWWNL